MNLLRRKATPLAHPRSLPAIERLTVPDIEADIYRELYRGVEYIVAAGVAGDVAEFGTSSGRTAMTLSKAIADYDERYRTHSEKLGIAARKLFLFDSFEGFPEASDPIDKAAPQISSGVWGPGVTKDASPSVLLDMCSTYLDAARIVITPGWYRDTMPKLQPGLELAMVHVDCDFYESTMDVLDRLFTIDAFSDGCVVFFDDWYCNRGSLDFGEPKAWADCVARHRPRFTDWGPYATVGHRFIVHK